MPDVVLVWQKQSHMEKGLASFENRAIDFSVHGTVAGDDTSKVLEVSTVFNSVSLIEMKWEEQ